MIEHSDRARRARAMLDRINGDVPTPTSDRSILTMTHLAQIPLETYLLAQQAAPIACLVCDHENCCSAARCRNCQAPMALAHQTQSVKKRPHMIAVIGASGAGKTVYLGLLMDMLTRHVGLLRSTARGPMSISLQQTTTTALATGWFPEKTVTTPEHWHWVHCQFNCRRRRRPLELVIPDVSGEAWRSRRSRPAAIRRFARCWPSARGVMVLADAERLQGRRPFAGLRHAQAAVAASASCATSKLARRRQRGPNGGRWRWCSPRRTSATDSIENPREFAEAHAGAVVERLPDAVPAARSVCLLGDRRDGVPRQLRPAAAGAAADRAARHHRAVWLADDGTGRKLEQSGLGGAACRVTPELNFDADHVASQAAQTGVRIDATMGIRRNTDIDAAENYVRIDHTPHPLETPAAVDHGAPHPHRADPRGDASGGDRAAGMARRPDVRGDRRRPGRAGGSRATPGNGRSRNSGAEAVEESRRQYLRHAQSVWNALRQQPDPAAAQRSLRRSRSSRCWPSVRGKATH